LLPRALRRRHVLVARCALHGNGRGEQRLRAFQLGQLLRGQHAAPPVVGFASASVYFWILTRVTSLVRLLASTKSPSRVTSVLRTMLPPPGMVQVWNFSLLGSKRTTVFGEASDSLYQMMPWIAEMT